MLLLLSVLLLVVGYRMGKRARAPRWLPWMTGLGAALLPTAVVRAATFTVPFVFSNGTVADATQMNQNMSTIAAEIDRLRKPVAVVTECEFRPRVGTAGYTCGFGQGGAFITDSSNGGLVGPVHVPQGATITSIDVFVNDTSATLDLHICPLAADDLLPGFNTSACVATSGMPGLSKLTLTPNVIQGNGSGWELFAFVQDASNTTVGWPSTGTDLTVRNACVHYEVP
jgi:hypothetical protein